MERNWNDIGLAWETDEVARRDGPNGSDRRVIGLAQIPVCTDLDKVRAHFGDGVVTGSLNGTSWRVMAQDVSRRGIEARKSDAEIREMVYNRLRGIRNASTGGTRTQFVAPLPDGTKWTGTDATAYQAECMAQFVDNGLDATVARTLAENMAKAIAPDALGRALAQAIGTK